MYLKVIFLIIFILFGPLIQPAKAQCTLKTTRDKNIRPIFLRNTDDFTSLVSNDEELLSMEENEKILAFCFRGFERPFSRREMLYNHQQETIICHNKTIQSEHKIFYGSIDSVYCQYTSYNPYCKVNLAHRKLSRPKFYKKIGTRYIQMTTELESFHLQYGQRAKLQCESKFKDPMNLKTELNIVCANGQNFALGEPFKMYERTFECEFLQWNLYESTKTFPWCPSKMASYIIARPAHQSANDYEYLGGICYDIETMSVKSLYYTDGPKSLKNMSSNILRTYKPSVQISEIRDIFISKNADNSLFKDWFKFSSYKNALIVQNHRLSESTLEDLQQLAEINWWWNLRLGNWRFYEAALAKEIESHNKQFDILAGVSGAVRSVVIRKNCEKDCNIMALLESDNNRMPLYVWNYLKSTNGTDDDVVIIGVNSPFDGSYYENDLVFCRDICHQIPWLQGVHFTFTYPAMGFVFCCSVDEVIASQRLDGFTIPSEWQPIQTTNKTVLEDITEDK